MRQARFIVGSPEQTALLGRMLGELIAGPAAVFLTGELGAGKTHFTQGLAAGLGVPAGEAVTSPTFILMNHYRGRLPLYHFDLYRLADAGEIEELGLADCLEGEGVTVIEWADRIPEPWPDGLTVALRYTGEQSRVLHFSARGEAAEGLLQQLLRCWQDRGGEHD